MNKNIFLSTLLFCFLCNFVSAQGKQFRALLFTKTMGFHHESILEGVTAIRDLGAKHFFDVDWQEDPSK
ncbi:MAG: ThuA domain-containing protein, partial [Saprospiraceae bacterium]